MARPILDVQGVSKTFGGRTLFDRAGFQLDAGDRAALVGPNGAGKTTLLHMLAGRETPDSGSVDILPHVSLTYFTQHAEHEKNATVSDVMAAGGGIPAVLAEELAAIETRMADPALYESPEANEVVARYGELQREVGLAKANSAPNPLDNVLFAEMGFTEEDLPRKASSLSGGERTRLLLARSLAKADPRGLLVLDEPTNHLDVETIEWLETWLSEYQGALLVVAHDRAFLDNVATRVLSLERGSLAMYVGGYTEFERRREEDAARLALQRERETKEFERQKAVVEQFKHQKRFNGQMASRLTALTKYRATIDKTPDPLVERVLMHVGFPETFKSSNEVIRIRGMGKKYGERVLFYDLALDLVKGDRMAVVGANGAGKTTLLRILTGREQKDIGNIEIAPGVKGAYYAQGDDGLDPRSTLRDEVLSARTGITPEDVRGLLGRFGFKTEADPLRKVSTLSGGERARLRLLKTIVTPSNLLILDEPTNHLDLETRQTLVQALNAYKGTLLVVSHDRWFLDSVVEKVAVLSQRSIKVFPGDFTTARTMAAMEDFSVGNPQKYLVKKAFKDYETGVRHTAGTTLKFTEGELDAKRIYRTALSMGWLVQE